MFVDSSGWIALFSARDQNHGAADRIFGRLVERQTALMTTNLILAEIHRLVLYRAGMSAAAASLERVASSPLVTIEFATSAHHRTALEWLQKLQSREITYTDAVSFAVMEMSRCPSVVTFDMDFELAGFSTLD